MELRWDPVLGEWIIVSGQREKRPHLPSDFCPFCPGAPEVPTGGWEILCLPNRFPSLMPTPPPPDLRSNGPYRTRPARGSCEIIVYTPEHDTTLAELSVDHIKKLVDVWVERFEELSRKKYVKYVFIFENKGHEIGVTLDHPHGQIYAFPFVPPRIKTELRSSKRHMTRTGKCLFCEILAREVEANLRIVCDNEHFVCFLPFFAHWPFGVNIYPRRHVQSLPELSDGERRSFAKIIKATLQKFDGLFGFSFPYMMVFHQKPTDDKTYQYYHFHVEFYPPYREKDKLKYFASVETGAGTITYDYSPELKAKQLRETRFPQQVSLVRPTSSDR